MSEEYPYNARLSRWEEIAEGLIICGVSPNEKPFGFEPGQYATLGLLGPQGKLVQRPMSISSAADRLDEYEFFIRLVAEGQFTPLLWRLRVGDPINLKGPKGRFLLQPDGRRCLFVASGTGLAPYISMIDTLRERAQSREVYLLHGVSYDHDLAWREHLERIEADGWGPLHYVATVSRPQSCPDWHGTVGRAEAVVEAQLDQFGLDPSNSTIYLCGNPDMISAVEQIAAGRGFPAEQIRKELFWPKGRSH